MDMSLRRTTQKLEMSDTDWRDFCMEYPVMDSFHTTLYLGTPTSTITIFCSDMEFELINNLLGAFWELH